MTVRTISGSGISQASSYTKNDKKSAKTNDTSGASLASTKSSDSLVLSEEAKATINIQSRIDNGFYDKPEVLEKVAKKLSLLV